MVSLGFHILSVCPLSTEGGAGCRTRLGGRDIVEIRERV